MRLDILDCALDPHANLIIHHMVFIGKCSDVFHSVSCQVLFVFFFLVLLLGSSSRRHKEKVDKMSACISLTFEA